MRRWRCQGKSGSQWPMLYKPDNDSLCVFRVKSGLAPLLSQVSQRKSELDRFDTSIVNKKNELQNYKSQIEEVTKNLRSVFNLEIQIRYSKRAP